MNNGVPRARLGNLLSRSVDTIQPQPDTEYREISVRLWGKGVVERGRVSGAQISNRRFVASAGDFIISRIDARNGASGLVPQSLAGALVTNDFPLFKIDNHKLLPAFFEWLTRTRDFIELCKRASEGTTNRVRLSEERFLALEIPLPPLAEQWQVVARIEELGAQIREARILRDQAAEEAQALLAAASDLLFQPKPNWKEVNVGDFCEQPQYGYTESATYDAVGPRFLRITDIQDGQVNWNSVPYCVCEEPEPYRLKKNDIVFARTGATTGKSFLIREAPDAVFASYLIRLRVRNLVTPEYLYRYFQSPSYWAQITDEKKGTGQPNVNGKKLSEIRVPIPPSEDQRRIVAELDALQAEVDALKRLQAETAAEINALLPSILDKAFKGEL
jgi:type I restriction enzyme, S subunit